jgi:iron(III) transport system substrate-binding protein
MADPKWRGKIGAADSPGGASLYANWKLMADVCGADFLPKMAQQNLRWFPSVAPLGQSLGAGEVVLAAHGMPHVLEPLKAQGAPVEWRAMDTMAVAARFAGIMKQAPHPHAARLFLNYLLSEEAQTTLYTGKQGVSPLRSVPDQVPLSPKWEAIDAANYPPPEIERIRKALGL